MKAKKTTVLTLADRCKNILASNWQAYFNTIKADAKGSKEDIYTSKVKFIMNKGKPYIWVPEKEVHNLNTIIDERASMSVASPFPGLLGKLLKSMNKLPARIALTGDVVALKEGKAQLAAGSLLEVIKLEQRLVTESSYTVSGVIRSSNLITTSRSENFKELRDGGDKFCVYKFNPSSCIFIDGHGRSHEVNLEDIATSEADPLAFLSARLIDGINQSEARRRALILFCLTYLNEKARGALMLSVDPKGFDLLAKVPGPAQHGLDEYQWKEFRFAFKEEARDLEAFCRQLVEMEEDAVKIVSDTCGLQGANLNERRM